MSFISESLIRSFHCFCFLTSELLASVQNVEDASASTRMLAQTTLRNILGTRTLSGILSEREEIAEEMLKILDEATDPWGE